MNSQRKLIAALSLCALARHQGKALQSYLLKAVSVSTLCLVCAAANADVFSVTQDTYTKATSPSIVYGTALRVAVQSSGPANGFIAFDVSSVSGKTIDSATLQLDVKSVNVAGTIDVRLVGGAWSESSLTFNSQPTLAAPSVSIPIAATDAGKTVSVDVTSVVQGWANGTAANYGLALTPKNVNAILGSKEGNQPAKLDVTVSSGGVPNKTHVNVPADFATIQLAIDNATVTWCPLAALRCTISIDAGEFQNFTARHMPPLTIKGAGENQTYLNGELRIYSINGSAIDIFNNSTLEIRDLTLMEDAEPYTDSISCDDSYGVLLNNVVVNGWISGNHGCEIIFYDVIAKRIYTHISASFYILRSQIEQAYVGDGGGISAKHSNFGTFIVSNEGDGAAARLENSTVSGNFSISTSSGNSYFEANNTAFNTIVVYESKAIIKNSTIRESITIDNSPDSQIIVKCINVSGPSFEYQQDCTPPPP